MDWQPFELVPSLIRLSDVCIIPHRKNPHTDTTLPHKLFQYMAMGKPVVVSDCASLRRVVEEAGCGRVFRSGDTDSLAEAIVSLRDDGERRRVGEAGKKAVMDGLNWAESSKKLVELYQSLDER
jgi:glycosyltransferase involved in cell wall biosynthesis